MKISAAPTLVRHGKAPGGYDALRMMPSVSEKGESGWRDFETEPLYIPHVC